MVWFPVEGGSRGGVASRERRGLVRGWFGRGSLAYTPPRVVENGPGTNLPRMLAFIQREALAKDTGPLLRTQTKARGCLFEGFRPSPFPAPWATFWSPTVLFSHC